MRVLYKGVGEPPNRVELPASIRALRASVGGPVEMHKIASSAAVVCNAEGATRDLPYNCSFLGMDWRGPVLIVGVNGEEFCDIPEGSFIFLESMVGRK